MRKPKTRGKFFEESAASGGHVGKLQLYFLHQDCAAPPSPLPIGWPSQRHTDLRTTNETQTRAREQSSFGHSASNFAAIWS